jgi:4-alpha-glucanotransferase
MPTLERTQALRAALRALGIKNFVLAIHDASFPKSEDDIGRGTSYSRAATELLEFARDLGFNGIQLGPQGQTSDINASPYDGTLFSRNVMNLPLATLVEKKLLSPGDVEAFVADTPRGSDLRCAYSHAVRVSQRALEQAFSNYQLNATDSEKASLQSFVQTHQSWLIPDALYAPLSRWHGVGDWKRWGGALDANLDQRLFSPRPGEQDAAAKRLASLKSMFAQDVEAYAFGQKLVHEAHEQLRERCRGLGLKLYGDLQVGFSIIDVWANRRVILETYRMGAPPSRTNLEGQPWNYAVLDPAQYFEAGALGPSLRLVHARMQKTLHEYDGVRIDHPHGLICPWVYRTDDADPFHAVQNGARLFDSPDLPAHPELAKYAIARPEQINRSVPPYADEWVTSADEAQVDGYSALFDVVVQASKENGRSLDDLLCEVLSTQPYPLRKVLERYGLGRFRVTQKADLDKPEDVYRSENARPPDWIMVGTHDTPPLWKLIPGWRSSGTHVKQAEYLAERLCPNPSERPAFAAKLASDDRWLVHAKFADIFASPATNVMVFFADLLGLTDVYNAPGVVSPENWMLRVPPDYATSYPRRVLEKAALNLPLALAWAMKAKGLNQSAEGAALITALESLA